jgi:hypothetical protein
MQYKGLNSSLMLLSCAVAMVAAGCASMPDEACNLQHAPPEARQLFQTGNIKGVVFPPQLPPGFSGCQRSWTMFDGSHKQSSPLIDVHFVAGDAVRFVSYETGAETAVVADCHYVRGTLDIANSIRPALCPQAAQLMSASMDGMLPSNLAK